MAKAATGQAAKARLSQLPVPVGPSSTMPKPVNNWSTFTEPGQELMVAKGGRGGRGNARFATSTHQAPTEHEDGKPGEFFETSVGIEAAGRRRAGRIPERGQIHAHFAPVCGQAQDCRLSVHHARAKSRSCAGRRSDVCAGRYPGLIEGAHEGHGLGIQFLRHVERTRLLVHMVDVSEFSGREPGEDFEVILRELESFSPELVEKPMLVVASKIDACQTPERIEAVRAKAAEHGLALLRDLERYG